MRSPFPKIALTLVAASAVGLAAAQSSTPSQEPAATATTPSHAGASRHGTTSTRPAATTKTSPGAQTLVDSVSDRSPQSRIERNTADAASPPHGPQAAASAAAAATAEHNAKAEADADLAARQAGDHGRLKVARQNLTGDAAKAALLRQGLGQPNYDHSISMGDKDHIEQVTNFKVYVQKPAVGQ